MCDLYYSEKNQRLLKAAVKEVTSEEFKDEAIEYLVAFLKFNKITDYKGAGYCYIIGFVKGTIQDYDVILKFEDLEEADKIGETIFKEFYERLDGNLNI